MRLLAGIPAVLIAVGLVTFAPIPIVVLLVVAAGIYGMHEYVHLLKAGLGYRLPYALLMTGALFIGLGAFGKQQGMGAMFFLAALASVFYIWFRRKEPTRDLQLAGSALLGLLLVPWLINHVGLLLQLPDGRGAVNLLIVVLTLNDTFAYLVGSLFGKHKLLPEVSPNKTIEGSIAGLVGGLLGGLISWVWLGGGQLGFGVTELCLLGIALAAVGQAGDLLESKLKRLAHADDSGTFLPGHGGLLDRLDSYLLAAPFFYYVLWMFYLP